MPTVVGVPRRIRSRPLERESASLGERGLHESVFHRKSVLRTDLVDHLRREGSRHALGQTDRRFSRKRRRVRTVRDHHIRKIRRPADGLLVRHFRIGSDEPKCVAVVERERGALCAQRRLQIVPGERNRSALADVKTVDVKLGVSQIRLAEIDAEFARPVEAVHARLGGGAFRPGDVGEEKTRIPSERKVDVERVAGKAVLGAVCQTKEKRTALCLTGRVVFVKDEGRVVFVKDEASAFGRDAVELERARAGNGDFIGPVFRVEHVARIALYRERGARFDFEGGERAAVDAARVGEREAIGRRPVFKTGDKEHGAPLAVLRTDGRIEGSRTVHLQFDQVHRAFRDEGGVRRKKILLGRSVGVVPAVGKDRGVVFFSGEHPGAAEVGYGGSKCVDRGAFETKTYVLRGAYRPVPLALARENLILFKNELRKVRRHAETAVSIGVFFLSGFAARNAQGALFELERPFPGEPRRKRLRFPVVRGRAREAHGLVFGRMHLHDAGGETERLLVGHDDAFGQGVTLVRARNPVLQGAGRTLRILPDKSAVVDRSVGRRDQGHLRRLSVMKKNGARSKVRKILDGSVPGADAGQIERQPASADTDTA